MLFDNKANEVAKVLIEKNETVAVAESVTSGYLQALISSALNAEQFYQGGITAYNIGQKDRHLSIEPVAAKNCNCVSEEVAKQMEFGNNKTLPAMQRLILKKIFTIFLPFLQYHIKIRFCEVANLLQIKTPRNLLK